MSHSYLDEYSDRDSMLHRRDPRVKLVLFFAFVMFVIMTPPYYFRTFFLYLAVLGGLVFISEVPLAVILKRSLSVVPFVLAIGCLIPFLKTGTTAWMMSFGSIKIRITYEGLLLFWNILIKSYLSAGAMMLLVFCTRYSDLLKGLSRMKCPQIFVMILSFMYRYIFVVEDELEQMLLAKRSRTVNLSRSMDLKVLSTMLGVLFIRAYERAESVYLAMCARGYEGQIHTLTDFRITKKDIYLVFAFIAILINIRFSGG